jgi:Zn-dependent protease
MDQQTEWLPPAPPGVDRGPEEPRPDPIFEERRPLYKRIGAGIAAVAVAIAKFFAQFKAVLLLLPKLKLLTTAGTMLVSVGAYALIWGWQFGIGVVLLLLVHEMGHYIQFRLEGVHPRLPVFVPFLGAYVQGEALDDPAAETRVALAGPILGGLGALALIPIYHATGNDLWRALAFFGFLINLFNLLPVSILDGNTATKSLSRSLWIVMTVGVIALAFLWPSPVLLIFVLVAVLRLFGHRSDGRARVVTQVLTAVAFLALIGALAYGTHATHLVRHFSDA